MKTSIRKLENKLSRANTSNLLHLVLSLLTMGIWIPIWILIAVSNALKRSSLIKKIERIEATQ